MPKKSRKPGTKAYYDWKIETFEKAKVKFFMRLEKHLDMFSPLSNEDEEKDMRKVLRLLEETHTLPGIKSNNHVIQKSTGL